MLSPDSYEAEWRLGRRRWYRATQVSGAWVLVEFPSGRGWVPAAAVPRPGIPLGSLLAALPPLAVFGFFLGGWLWLRLVVGGSCAHAPLLDGFGSDPLDPCAQSEGPTTLALGWGIGLILAGVVFWLLARWLGGVARERGSSRGPAALWLVSVAVTGLLIHFLG